MSVTSKDIAQLCGVSQGTVDRALNNRPGISPATKKKIMDTVESLGYRPHLLARSLVKGKTMTIGLVVFDLYNRFFAQLVNEIEIHARAEGYFVYLTLTNKSMDEEKACIEHLVSRQVDGLILCSVHKNGEFEKYLDLLNIPVITIGNSISPQFPFIGIDDFSAMKAAAEHVLLKGYKRIIYVSPPLSARNGVNLYAQEKRLSGFLDALKEYGPGTESLVIDSKDYIKELEACLSKKHIKPAILCSSDIYALEILNHCGENGIRVPEDAGLMGFDNIDILKYVRPLLTTVSYPLDELGKKAVSSLIYRIKGQPVPGNLFLNHRIIEGNSL